MEPEIPKERKRGGKIWSKYQEKAVWMGTEEEQQGIILTVPELLKGSPE